MITEQGNNLIFICGLPRSGTTLLNAILGNHPEVYAPPEPWILLRLAEVYGEGVDSKRYDDHVAAQAVREMMDSADFDLAARSFALTAYNRLLAKGGGSMLVDKTPRYYHILDWIETLFPQARMIWLKRNLLDVAASYKCTWQRDVSFLTGETFDSTSFDFLQGIPNLIAFFDKPGDNRFEIQYERLVSHPEEEIRRLTAFCHLEYRPDMKSIGPEGRGLKAMAASSYGDKKIYQTQGIHEQSLNNWENHLSRSEAMKLNAVIGPRAYERMGYADFVKAHAELFQMEEGDVPLNQIRQRLVAKAKTMAVSTLPRMYELEEKNKEYERKLAKTEQILQEAHASNVGLAEQARRLKEEAELMNADRQRQAEIWAEVCRNQEEKIEHLVERRSHLEDELTLLRKSQVCGGEASEPCDVRLNRLIESNQLMVAAMQSRLQDREQRLEKLGEQKMQVLTELFGRQELMKQMQLGVEKNEHHMASLAQSFSHLAALTETERKNHDQTARELKSRIISLEDQCRQLEDQCRQLEDEKRAVLNSRTYRLGNAIARPLRVWLPRRGDSAHALTENRISAAPGVYPQKIDLADQLQTEFGQHRSGWKYCLKYLDVLHNPDGVLFDSFIERTFSWHPDGVKPHTRPWVGVIHVPPSIPDWFLGEQSNQALFKTRAWLDSLPLCRGLFVLSDYHRKALEKILPIPVNRLYFASEKPDCLWTWDGFRANKNKRIVQVGWWLRQLHAIYRLPESSYCKTFLDPGHPVIPGLMKTERGLLEKGGLFHPEMLSNVETLSFLSDDQYDRLLSENIVFLNLYDASANNAVIECIQRNTPLLVNPLEAVREYLGEGYPLYYDNLAEAVSKAEDLDLVRAAHEYLKNLPIKARLTGEHFLADFAGSEIYQAL